jgi:hypothetical protein
MVADPGTFSGTPEAAVYLKNLQRRRTYPKGTSACAALDTGVIMGQPVAVITTGEALQCENCASLLDWVAYFG